MPATAVQSQLSSRRTPTIIGNSEDFPVQKKVHSLAVDLNTHRVYAPEQEENGRPVSRMIILDAVK